MHNRRYVSNFYPRARVKWNYLRFYTGTNSINTPISCIVVIKMYFSKPYTGMALACAIEETMMNSHPDASIPNMRWVCSYQHCLVMIGEIAPSEYSFG
jgi:hypothetical protein